MLLQAQHVMRVLLVVEADQRAYVITGHSGLLELCDAGRHELETSFDRLAWITGENGSQQAYVGELRKAVAAKFA